MRCSITAVTASQANGAKGASRIRPRCLLFMTVNAYQVHGLIETIRLVDPKVFINVSKTDKIIGSYYQKPLD